MSDAPQLADPDAPFQASQNGMQHSSEKAAAPVDQPQWMSMNQHGRTHADEANRGPRESSTILGLRRRYFWIWVILGLIVIAAAIGGGVGGAMAVRNSGSNLHGGAAPAQSALTTGTSVASTLASSSPVASSTSVYTPPPATAITLIDSSCPPSGSLKAISGVTYNCYADTNISGDDITGIYAYSFQQCVDACSTMNLRGSGTPACKAVVLERDALKGYTQNSGANCWLKSAAEPRVSENTNSGKTAAIAKA